MPLYDCKKHLGLQLDSFLHVTFKGQIKHHAG